MTPDEGRRNDAEQLRDTARFLRRCRGTEPAAHFEAHAIECDKAADLLDALSPAGRRPPESADRDLAWLLRDEAAKQWSIGDSYLDTAPDAALTYFALAVAMRAGAEALSPLAESAREAVRPPAAATFDATEEAFLEAVKASGLELERLYELCRAGQDTRDAS